MKVSWGVASTKSCPTLWPTDMDFCLSSLPAANLAAGDPGCGDPCKGNAGEMCLGQNVNISQVYHALTSRFSVLAWDATAIVHAS